MLVELKNGETLNGHLVNCDTWMNLTLKEVVQTSPVRIFLFTRGGGSALTWINRKATSSSDSLSVMFGEIMFFSPVLYGLFLAELC